MEGFKVEKNFETIPSRYQMLSVELKEKLERDLPCLS